MQRGRIRVGLGKTRAFKDCGRPLQLNSMFIKLGTVLITGHLYQVSLRKKNK